MKAPAFAYTKPHSLSEVFHLLERYGEDARLLAGGQSLMPALNMRLSAPAVLIDITAIGALRGIQVRGKSCRIGALTRHVEVERSPEIARHVPLLARAMRHVAHAAVRNRGTFGGSVAFADPAAEIPAVALALDMTFRVASAQGERIVRARDFFRGLYETALAPNEVLLEGEVAAIEAGERVAFQELARRHGDYAMVGVAAQARVREGVLSDVRLAYFGIGAKPLLARAAASILEGDICSADVIEKAQAALETELEPYSDPQTSAATKKHLARVLLGRVVSELLA